ncbi:glycosyltransferase [Winogradskyella endarachnes]|uniref:glycosyltransferase n=1 Tax=Winogradskyella endarachnes TaxID=2681965 RepID=UPI0018D2128C|nr:glycosyltransferase [Winogradskyella endarachnes]
MVYKHFLITRFNLRNPKWVADKKNAPILTDQWHDNRFKLFNDFCFESVNNQTNKNFQWLVFFDTTTPQKYRDIIDSFKSRMDNFYPIYIDGMDLYLPSIKDYISNFNEEYIITSRLDNDDCISKYYIEEVQKRFNKQHFMAIDFIDGYSLQIKPNVKIGKRIDQYSPFISLIEKNDNPKTVWSASHSHWKREKNVQFVRHVNLWTAVSHLENKVNGFGGYGKVNIDDYLNTFIISKNQQDYIKQHIIPANNFEYYNFKMRLKSHFNYQYKNLKKALGVYKYK